jgi:hypothetical protein
LLLAGSEDQPAGQHRPVWTRKEIILDMCPKSYITAESNTLVEEFLVRRRLGAFDLDRMSARQVEAFAVLEGALRAEKNNGQHNARRAS